MKKKIAIEIGHWYDPGDRYYEDNHGEWWEFYFNYEVGRHIHNELECHGFSTVFNGTFGMFNGITGYEFEEAFNQWKLLNHADRAGAMGGKDLITFYNDLSNMNPDELVACIAVHFNAGGGQGFEVFSQTNDMKLESAKLSQSIADEMTGLVQKIRYGNQHDDNILKDYLKVKDPIDPQWGLKNTGIAIAEQSNRVPAPVAYCEFGFYDNPDDREYFNTPAKLKAYGTAAAIGILKYLGIIDDDTNPKVGDDTNTITIDGYTYSTIDGSSISTDLMLQITSASIRKNPYTPKHFTRLVPYFIHDGEVYICSLYNSTELERLNNMQDGSSFVGLNFVNQGYNDEVSLWVCYSRGYVSSREQGIWLDNYYGDKIFKLGEVLPENSIYHTASYASRATHKLSYINKEVPAYTWLGYKGIEIYLPNTYMKLSTGELVHGDEIGWDLIKSKLRLIIANSKDGKTIDDVLASI